MTDLRIPAPARRFPLGRQLNLGWAFVDRQTVRLSVLVQTSALVLASALVFIDLGFLAWIIALGVVATAAYDAATGGWIEAGLYWRIARRRRP